MGILSFMDFDESIVISGGIGVLEELRKNEEK
jgi:hypothetical protein